jgi:hypothetical protein
MANVETHIQLSWSQVDAWEQEIAALQRKVDASKVLLPPRAERPPVAASTGGNGQAEDSGDTTNFMGSVVEIANSVQWPITKAEMRHRLQTKGFSEDKLGKRLDVILYKTKTANRLTFENGLISGAPK